MVDTADKPHPRHRRPWPIRVVQGRPRLFISILIGVIAAALTPSDWRIAVRTW
jgi:hypothetical protein